MSHGCKRGEGKRRRRGEAIRRTNRNEFTRIKNVRKREGGGGKRKEAEKKKELLK